MPVLFELVVVFGVVYLLARILPPWLRARAQLRAEREAHRRRLEMMEKTDELLKLMLTDKEMAEDVYARLGRLLGEAEHNDADKATSAGGDDDGGGNSNGGGVKN